MAMEQAALNAGLVGETKLGEELEELLEALHRAGLKLGPRDRVAALTLAAELIARGRVRGLADLRFSLRPLLARSTKNTKRSTSSLRQWQEARRSL